jgi:hypothetical protein
MTSRSALRDGEFATTARHNVKGNVPRAKQDRKQSLTDLRAFRLVE